MGRAVGFLDGSELGLPVGFADGEALGFGVTGFADGDALGLPVVGFLDGSELGLEVIDPEPASFELHLNDSSSPVASSFRHI